VEEEVLRKEGRGGEEESAHVRFRYDVPPVVPEVRRHTEQRQSVLGKGRIEEG
jgi:hypothetical protein